jgi:toxin ParE1/3/4
MVFEIIVKPLARIDLDEAILWYENKLNGLGERFYQAFLTASEAIRKSPDAFIEISPDIRRIIIKKFPYKLFYTISENKVFIIGIIHAKRSAGFITSRLNEGLK